MAFTETVGQDPANSRAFTVPLVTMVADPFDPSQFTLGEIVNSTAEDWAGFYVNTHQRNFDTDYGIMIVCKGAIGSEVRVASMPYLGYNRADYRMSIYVPVPIPAGTRLTVGASSIALITIECQIVGVPSSNFAAEPNFTVMDCGPFNLEGDVATYALTPTVDPGGTTNTKGPYTELSITGGVNSGNNVLNGDQLDHQYGYLGFLIGDNRNPASRSRAMLYDLAHGAAASETNVLTELCASGDSQETGGPIGVVWIPWDRPAGDRIAARMQSSTSDATDRVGSVLMFGLR